MGIDSASVFVIDITSPIVVQGVVRSSMQVDGDEEEESSDVDDSASEGARRIGGTCISHSS